MSNYNTEPYYPSSSSSSSYSDDSDSEAFLGWDHSQRETQRERRMRESQNQQEEEAQYPDASSHSHDYNDDSEVYIPERFGEGNKSPSPRHSATGTVERDSEDKKSGVVFRARESIINVEAETSGRFQSNLEGDYDEGEDYDDYDDDEGSTSSTSTIEEDGDWSLNVKVEHLNFGTAQNSQALPIFTQVGLISNKRHTKFLNRGLNQFDKGNIRTSMVQMVGGDGVGDNDPAGVAGSDMSSSNDHPSIDFEEEIRWDEVYNPRDKILAIELCVRGNVLEEWNVSSNNNDDMEENNNDEEVAGHNNAGGIRGLIRKTRASFMSKPQEYDKYLLEKQQSGSSVKSRAFDEQSSHSGSSARMGMGLHGSWAASQTQQPNHWLSYNENDLLDYDEDIEEDAPSASQSQNAPEPFLPKYQMPSKPAPLRLACLSIPLSELPLDQAMNSNTLSSAATVAFVEKWFTLDWNIVGGNPELQNTANRNFANSKPPSIFLELSFATKHYLDESEDEFDANEESEHGSVDQDALWSSQTGGRLQSVEDDSSTDDDAEAKFIESQFGGGGMPPHQPTKTSQTSQSMRRRSQNSFTGGPRRSSFFSASAGTGVSEKSLEIEPTVDPGIVDFICVVGSRDLGSQRDDDGTRGWVKTDPDTCILEQFPPDDEFHMNMGRVNAKLEEIVGWCCFPEGCKVWRGTGPPQASNLNIPERNEMGTMQSTSYEFFDSFFKCTTTFTWFAFATNSADYGSESRTLKIYGACIRFYVPAPYGVDRTQNDFAQPETPNDKDRKTLWVPLAVCLTTSLPIVGVLEDMLLRISEMVANATLVPKASHNTVTTQDYIDFLRSKMYPDLANLIINYPSPVPGVLHCSIPFLSGERLHVTLPPFTGLPPLPHGGAVKSVCRLLGSEGFTILLSAFLTDCKILLHSYDVANIAMVAEVMCCLIYPFSYVLPYLPILPHKMLEYIESPIPYCMGVSSNCMSWINKQGLSDVVVMDLDKGFNTPDYFDGRTRKFKLPSPLPASVSVAISKAFFRLIRQEQELEEQFGHVASYSTSRHLPRLESESLAEREFRIAVAIQISSLLRGYQDCLFFVSASQPVFNVDKFLRNAPALFEERPTSLSSVANGMNNNNAMLADAQNPANAQSGATSSQKILSPRSKKFLASLVNTQHFRQLLERLDVEDASFFHEIMDALEQDSEEGFGAVDTGSKRRGSSSSSHVHPEQLIEHLKDILQEMEDAIPTYRVDRSYTNRRNKRSSMDSSNSGWGMSGLDEDSYDLDDELGESLDDFECLNDDFIDDDIDLSVSNLEEVLGKKTSNYCFTKQALAPVLQQDEDEEDGDGGSEERGEDHKVRSLSVRYLVELEKKEMEKSPPWIYKEFLKLMEEQEGIIEVRDKVTLREAIGENRYRAFMLKKQRKNGMNNMAAGEGTAEEDMLQEMSAGMDARVSVRLDKFGAGPGGISAANLSEENCLDLNILLGAACEDEEVEVNDAIRKCLSVVPLSKNDELIRDAELALRDPSGQKFLLSVLSQRTQFDAASKRGRGHPTEGGAKPPNRGNPSASLLSNSAFETLCRLCSYMLDVCMEKKFYQDAYRLLTQTAGFCADNENNIIYMTAKMRMHPIFADLRLWEKVLLLHIKDHQAQAMNSLDNSGSGGGGAAGGRSSPTPATFGSDKKEMDAVNYDAAVSTLYEMLGYGVPAEELARFATRVSEYMNWFATERGQNLVVLARWLSVRRDDYTGQTEMENLNVGGTASFDILGTGNVNETFGREPSSESKEDSGVGAGVLETQDLEWKEVCWFHPASILADHSRRSSVNRGTMKSGYTLLGGMLGQQHNDSTTLKPMMRSDYMHQDSTGSNSDAVVTPKGYMGRTPITSVGCFGRNCIATGGLDGSVFLAHTIDFGSVSSAPPSVRGIRLEWAVNRAISAHSSSTSDSTTPLKGSVSCLASAYGAQHSRSTSDSPEDVLNSLEGCRIIAGTTSGYLNVWNVKDIYNATVIASSKDMDEKRRRYVLSGKALGGHEGGVTCIDVPSPIYRPDALVSGGADGHIKLWSLRNTLLMSTGSSHRAIVTKPGGVAPASATAGPTGMFAHGRKSTSPATGGMLNKTLDWISDAQMELVGHKGKVHCVRTAWHGDALLSGGADRTVRLWDLNGGNSGDANLCLQTFKAHLGPVTQAHYWGPHTIVSASSDRSVAICDARVGPSPLFILRSHRSYVSDLLLGSRSEPLIVSAGADGTIATWDFRLLPSSNKDPESSATTETNKHLVQTIRCPVATMVHGPSRKKSVSNATGSVILARGLLSHKTVLSASIDGIVKEWDINTGRLLGELATGHTDAISNFLTYKEQADMDGSLETSSIFSNSLTSGLGGMITCGWDGCVKLRRCHMTSSSGTVPSFRGGASGSREFS